MRSQPRLHVQLQDLPAGIVDPVEAIAVLGSHNHGPTSGGFLSTPSPLKRALVASGSKEAKEPSPLLM